jgi:FkbM family methyltransferase
MCLHYGQTLIRKIVPRFLQVKLWDYVLKSKGKKLRGEIVRYLDDDTNSQTVETKEAIVFLKNNPNGLYSFDFLKIWLKDGSFDFNGAKLPDISTDKEKMNALLQIFQDTFLFSCMFNDNYEKSIIDIFDPCMMEGPYGYKDGKFDVTVKENDTVIDAGAWIGDFSAYAASKRAQVYSFEPVSRNYVRLKETANLNDGKILPIQKGLGKEESEVAIYINASDSAGSSMFLKRSKVSEKMKITTLDNFVMKNKIEKIDFIKADIEGGERDLLRGAVKVLKECAPKLAICTYHSPEDPELLEKIIKEANPKYTIVHTAQKLFAMVQN